MGLADVLRSRNYGTGYEWQVVCTGNRKDATTTTCPLSRLNGIIGPANRTKNECDAGKQTRRLEACIVPRAYV